MLRHQTKIFFPNLDGLRFIAFFAVFFHHTFLPAYFDAAKSSAFYQFLYAQKLNGSLGVNLFFVLSGFLITYLLITEKEQRLKINIPNFYLRRVLRIWPLYFFIVAIGFFLFPLVKKMMGVAIHETATLPFYIFFISNFELMEKGLADSIVLNVLWSVGIEEQFYLVWPLVLTLLPRKYFVKAFILFIAGTLVFRYLHASNYSIIYFHTIAVFSDMVLGGLAAYLSFFNRPFKSFIAHLPKKAIQVVYLAGLIIIVFNYKIFTSPLMIVFERIIYACFFAFIILEQNFAIHSFYKISNNKFLSQWGNYTYGLYCLHTAAIIIAHLFSERILKLNNLLALMAIDYTLGLALAMLLAYISYTYFEAPFLKLKNKFAYFTRQ